MAFQLTILGKTDEAISCLMARKKAIFNDMPWCRKKRNKVVVLIRSRNWFNKLWLRYCSLQSIHVFDFRRKYFTTGLFKLTHLFIFFFFWINNLVIHTNIIILISPPEGYHEVYKAAVQQYKHICHRRRLGNHHLLDTSIHNCSLTLY